MHIKSKFGRGFNMKIKLDFVKIKQDNNHLRVSKEMGSPNNRINQTGEVAFTEQSAFEAKGSKVIVSINKAMELLENWLSKKSGTEKSLDFERELSYGGLLSFYYEKIENQEAIDLQSFL